MVSWVRGSWDEFVCVRVCVDMHVCVCVHACVFDTMRARSWSSSHFSRHFLARASTRVHLLLTIFRYLWTCAKKLPNNSEFCGLVNEVLRIHAYIIALFDFHNFALHYSITTCPLIHYRTIHCMNTTSPSYYNIRVGL